MTATLRIFLRIALLFPLVMTAGCCCCNLSALQNAGGGGGATSTVDPAEAKDLENATQHAQKALNLKGYGEIATVALRKDNVYWYVEGTCAGKEGGLVNYMVMFQVNQFDDRQTWSVQTVKINDEVVYP